jgi:hypothetical protein
VVVLPLLMYMQLMLLSLLLDRCHKAAVCRWCMWLKRFIIDWCLTVGSTLCCYTSWLPLPVRCVLPYGLMDATAASAAAADSTGWPGWLQGLQQQVRATRMTGLRMSSN